MVIGAMQTKLCRLPPQGVSVSVFCLYTFIYIFKITADYPRRHWIPEDNAVISLKG